MGELKENNNKMNLKNKNKNKASWFGFFFFWVCCWLGAQGIIFGSVITLGGQGGTGSGLITAQLLFCAQLDGPTAGRFGGERPRRRRRRDPVC
jgi:hypothetical protein